MKRENPLRKIWPLPFLLLIFTVVAEVHAGEKIWGYEAELSFVDTGGNTKVTTLSAKNTLKYSFSERTLGTWKLGALFGRAGGERNAERYFTEFRLDRLYTDRLYFFTNAGWFKDKFAGIDPRYYFGAGSGYKFLVGPSSFLLGEAGLTYTAEDYTDGTDKNYLGGRLFGLYEYAFAEKNRFSQSLEWLPDFDETDNWLLNSETALISALNGIFSLKASYEVKYDNQPVAGNEHADTVLGITIVASY